MKTFFKFKVSAIVSTFNSSIFIEGCIEDLIAQTIYKKNTLEIIVIDSASEQNEQEIINSYILKYKNIRYIRTENRESLYLAWNRAISIAQGQYITNANTDDRHRFDSFEILSDCLDKTPQAEIAYADCYVSNIKNETFEQNKKDITYIYPDFFPPSAILHYQLGPQSMWRKSLHDRIGYFNTDYKAAGDWDFNLRVAMRYHAIHIPEFLGVFHKSPDSITRRDDSMRRENQNIKKIWRQSQIIEQLYLQAGFVATTPREKSQIWIDMGLRALEFYPPWASGNPDRDTVFAQSCFEKAMDYDSSWATPINNLSILIALQQDAERALKILSTSNKKFSNPIIYKNIKLLSNNTDINSIFFKLQFLPSELNFPTQKKLSNLKFNQNKNLYAKSKIKILFICHDFPPHRIAGAQIYIKNLAKALNNTKLVDVDIIHPVFRGELKEREIICCSYENLTVYKYGKIQTGNNFLQVRDTNIFNDLKKFLSQKSYDLIHVHTLAEFTGAALEACIDSKIPTIMTAHDQWLLCEQWFMVPPKNPIHCGGPTTAEKCAKCFLQSTGMTIQDVNMATLVKYEAVRLHYLRKLAHQLKALYVPSHSLARDFTDFGITGAEVIPLGITPAIPLQKIANRPFTIGYFGHIRPAKGVHTLVKAFAKYCSFNSKLELHGNCSDNSYLNLLISLSMNHPGISFCGEYDQKDVSKIYAGVDLMVNPSMNESFSITVRESFQQNVPVVASDVGGIPEVVSHGRNGFLFEPGNVDALGRILRKLSNEPNTLNFLKTNFPHVASIDDNAASYYNIYNKITRS